MDPRFEFQTPSPWQKDVPSQPLFGTEILEISAVGREEANPRVVEFELPEQGILLPGINTKLLVKAQFQKEKADGTFEGLTAADAVKVAVVPNWFEKKKMS